MTANIKIDIIEEELKSKKCSRCKHNLSADKFFYNDKTHKVCITCMKNKKRNYCPCGTRASFGFKNDLKATCCKKCKKEGMINLVNKNSLCPCGKSPSFGFETDKKPSCCNKCKKQGMINLSTKNKLCLCGTRASFGFVTDKKPSCCKKCSRDGMINLGELCLCGKLPSFGFETDKKPSCCKACKQQGMINLINKNKLCPCGIKSSFGFASDTKPSCCNSCKKEGMISFTNRSRFCKCGFVSAFGFETDEKPTCCSKCRLPGMINLSVNICNHALCKTTASYGYPLNQPSKCSKHKLEGMISKPRAKCSHESCCDKAIYGIKIPIYCFLHKTIKDIDLTERACFKCGKLDVLNEDGICINFCLLNDKGYELYQKQRKTKELYIVDLLINKFGKATYQDQIIFSENKSNNYRPDIVYELENRVIIIEVDEKQHNGNKYNCVDENIGQVDRMLEIQFSFSSKKVFFVRYNPDSYKVKDRVQKISQEKRENNLINWLQFLFSCELEKLPQLGVLYLYYNEFDCNSKKYFEIVIKDKVIVQKDF